MLNADLLAKTSNDAENKLLKNENPPDRLILISAIISWTWLAHFVAVFELVKPTKTRQIFQMLNW